MYSAGNYIQYSVINHNEGDFLEMQWLRLCLPMKWVRAQSLFRELDPTCFGIWPKLNKFKKLLKNHNENNVKIYTCVYIYIHMLVNKIHTYTCIYMLSSSSSFVNPCIV